MTGYTTRWLILHEPFERLVFGQHLKLLTPTVGMVDLQHFTTLTFPHWTLQGPNKHGRGGGMLKICTHPYHVWITSSRDKHEHCKRIILSSAWNIYFSSSAHSWHQRSTGRTGARCKVYTFVANTYKTVDLKPLFQNGYKQTSMYRVMQIQQMGQNNDTARGGHRLYFKQCIPCVWKQDVFISNKVHSAYERKSGSIK